MDVLGLPLGTILGQGGPIGLVTLFVVMMFFGYIRPRSAVAEIREDRDARIAELREQNNLWRAAHNTSEQARAELVQALNLLSESARLSEVLLEAIRNEVDREVETTDEV